MKWKKGKGITKKTQMMISRSKEYTPKPEKKKIKIKLDEQRLLKQEIGRLGKLVKDLLNIIENGKDSKSNEESNQ